MGKKWWMKWKRAYEEGSNRGECGVSSRQKRVLELSFFLFNRLLFAWRASHLYNYNMSWCAAVRPSALIPTRQLPVPGYLSVTPHPFHTLPYFILSISITCFEIFIMLTFFFFFFYSIHQQGVIIFKILFTYFLKMIINIFFEFINVFSV